MPNMIGDHPSPDQLAAYGSGKLDDERTNAIENHLSECEHCARTVSELPGDTVVGLLRAGREEARRDTAATAAVTSDDATRPPEALHETVPPSDNATDASLGAPAAAPEIPPELAEHPRYEILERLGEGGMGRVFKARHKFMNRVIALKIISRKLVSKPQAVERFRREVHAAASLSHPNIVTAHDAEQAGDLHFLAMEFVDGTDLEQLVQREGPLPVALACDYIRQAAEGLQQAHEQGMVHRDIKPHNIMVAGGQVGAAGCRPDGQGDADGEMEGGGEGEQDSKQTASGVSSSPPHCVIPAQIKILDFGLASLAAVAAEERGIETGERDGDGETARLTMAGTMMGTPDYIAPEQGRDAAAADIRSDIYSLGCTFYFLLAGRPPFDEGSILEKLHAHTSEQAQPLVELRDDVPVEVSAIVQKMMAKNPAERFQTPAEVASALHGVGSIFSDDVPAKPLSDARAVGKKAPDPVSWRGRTFLAAAAATLLVALAVAAVIFYIQTDYGVVRVEVADPSLRVELEGDTITTEDGNKRLTIRPGERTLVVRRGGFTFETDSFLLRRGGAIALEVKLLDGEIVVMKDGVRFGAKALPARPPSPASTPTESEVEELLEGADIAMNFDSAAAFEVHRIIKPGDGTGDDESKHQPKFTADGLAGDALDAAGGTLRIDGYMLHGQVDYTIAMWIYDNGRSEGVPGRTVLRETLIKEDGDTASNFEFAIDDGRVWWQPGWTSRESRQMKSPEGSVASGRWLFIALTSAVSERDRMLRLTVNNQSTENLRIKPLEKILPGTRGIPHTDTVGGYLELGGFNGKLDEFVIVPRALTEQQISVLYRYGLAGKELPEHAASRNAIAPLKLAQEFAGHKGDVVALRFVPNGDEFLSVGTDAALRRWNLETGAATTTSLISDGISGGIAGADISAGGKLAGIICPRFGTTQVWDIAGGKELVVAVDYRRLHADEIAFSPDGSRFLLSGSGRPVLRDSVTGDEVMGFENLVRTTACAVSPDGRHVAFGVGDREVFVGRASDGKRAGGFNSPYVGITALTFGTKYLIAGHADGGIWINKPALPLIGDESLGFAFEREADEGVSRRVRRLELFGDERYLLATFDNGLIRIFDLDRRGGGEEPLVAQVQGSPGSAAEAAISPDGRYLLTAGRTIHLWQLPESVWPESEMNQ